MTKPVTGLDCLIPTTLEVNVRYLHDFLFASESYEPSDTIKIRSEFVAEKTGFGNASVTKEWQYLIKEDTDSSGQADSGEGDTNNSQTYSEDDGYSDDGSYDVGDE